MTGATLAPLHDGGANLDLDAIQGNIVPGFSKDHQAFVFVRFTSDDKARAWLRAVQSELASAAEVQSFKSAFDSVRARAPHPAERDRGALNHLAATWVNVALSFAGLRALPGLGGLAAFPAAFRSNRVPGADAAAAPDGEMHAALIVAADRPADLQAELHRQREVMSASGVIEQLTLAGDTLPGDQRGQEHFGFKDAVSQPAIAGTCWGNGSPVAPGEFILGYPDQSGQVSGAALPAWTRNGSFLAFVQMQQHVATFWSAMKQYAQQLGVKPEDVASWTVGRAHDAASTDPGDKPSPLSHVGRGYARWLPPTESLRHRIIRRGIPYGPPLPAGQPEDFAARGLLFASYQSDLERQFLHVWRRWLNGPDFPFAGAGRDAMVGQPSMQKVEGSAASDPAPRPGSPTARRQALIPRPQGGSIVATLPAFVTPLYGAYLLAPSIKALSFLSGQT